MFDFSPWLSQLYEFNLQSTVVWGGIYEDEKLDKMVAQIVIKSLLNFKGKSLYKKKADTSVFSSKTKNIT